MVFRRHTDAVKLPNCDICVRDKALCIGPCRWGGQKALQRWEPAPGEEGLEELESGTFQPGWNQFDLNKQKFGVQSTWDEVRHPPPS